jgi:hypothetical protein
VDLLGSTDDRVGRADLAASQQPVQISSATKASNATVILYRREVDLDPESGGNGFGDGASARRAERRRGFAASQSGCRLRTTDEAALAALRARQEGLQFGFERVFLDRQVACGDAEQRTEGEPQKGQTQDGNPHDDLLVNRC